MTDWDQAACLHANPDLWFPDVGEDAWPAKLICKTACPIMRDCRQFGLSVPVGAYMGVYGGLSERERRHIQAGRLSEAEVDARDAEFMSAGGRRALAGMRGGETKRRQADERSRQARCGTASGYKAHRRLGEDACEECSEANRMYQREHKRRQKGVAA